jgi:hypothetical protein
MGCVERRHPFASFYATLSSFQSVLRKLLRMHDAIVLPPLDTKIGSFIKRS